MFTTKSRIAALLILTILILSAGRICIPGGAYGEAAPAPEPPKVPKEMLERRLEAAKAVWEIKWDLWQRNRMPLGELFGWSERLLEAELPLREKQNDRIEALKAHVDRTRKIEQIASNLFESARGSSADAQTARYERINAEIRYFQATGKALPSPEKKK